MQGTSLWLSGDPNGVRLRHQRIDLLLHAQARSGVESGLGLLCGVTLLQGVRGGASFLSATQDALNAVARNLRTLDLRDLLVGFRRNGDVAVMVLLHLLLIAFQ